MTIRFDSDRHDAFVTALREATAGIQGCLHDLDVAVAGQRDAWDGDARHAYDRAQRQWTESMTRLGALLDRTAAGAAVAGARLVAADTVAARLWA